MVQYTVHPLTKLSQEIHLSCGRRTQEIFVPFLATSHKSISQTYLLSIDLCQLPQFAEATMKCKSAGRFDLHASERSHESQLSV